jgi:antitoxin component of RelBE/YafQ-DinJ toxin-antitoxin module
LYNQVEEVGETPFDQNASAEEEQYVEEIKEGGKRGNKVDVRRMDEEMDIEPVVGGQAAVGFGDRQQVFSY